MAVVNINGIGVLFDAIPAAQVVPIKSGVGSVYTYIASGTAGQSAVIEGSADGTVWVHVITLTIDVGQTSETATKQHVFPILRVTGTARLQICRGAA